MIQLDWDSGFFGFPVFKLRLGADNVHLLDGIECGNEGVCYVFATPEASKLAKCRLEALGAVKYGVRKEFERNLSEDDRQIDERISCLSQLDDEAYHLAVKSGVCSRFAKDPRFKGKFEELYRVWLDKCMKNSADGKGRVFTVSETGKPSGIIAVSIDGDKARIELLAVSEKHRGRGIGRALVNAAFNHAASQSCRTIVVATQGENKPACNLYEKCGFGASNEEDVWHLSV